MTKTAPTPDLDSADSEAICSTTEEAEGNSGGRRTGERLPLCSCWERSFLTAN